MDPRGAPPAGTVLEEGGRSSAGVDAASLLVAAEAPRPSSAASRPRTPFLAGLLGNGRSERSETAPAPDPEAPQEAQPARAVGSETQSVVSDDSATLEAQKKVSFGFRRRTVMPAAFNYVDGGATKVNALSASNSVYFGKKGTTSGRQVSAGSSSVFESAVPALRGRWRRTVEERLESGPATALVVLVTLWALVGDDVRLTAFHKQHDRWFLIGTLVCISHFTAELVLFSIVKRGYFCGFYFWLDVIATLSLFFDIPAFVALFNPVGAGQTSGQGGTLARAGRSANAGSKMGRILRLVRVIQLLRRIYKYEKRMREARRALAQGDSDAYSTMRKLEHPRNARVTRVGAKLSDLTTRRVILGVLFILCITPIFDVRFFPAGDINSFEAGGLQMLHSEWASCAAAVPPAANASDACGLSPGAPCSAAFAASAARYAAQTSGMLQLHVQGVDLAPLFDLPGVDDTTREAEIMYAFAGDTSEALFERRWQSTLQGILNLARTVFLCGILGLGAFAFSRDANRLVLQPIKRMVAKVEEISANPLKGLADAHAAADAPASAAELTPAAKRAAKEVKNYETRILELSINKICSLMAVGFGDAGAEIIAENMRNGGALNPMVPGKKMVAIFGFCDIRQFTDTTEVLQEDVMEFVNSIAKIVHTEVARHGGSANKNIGDAFLLVWKFPDSVSASDVALLAAGEEAYDSEAAAAVAEVADAALAAFVLINAGLRRSVRLAGYSANPALNERIPNFRVKMGFGMHVGWAIEGAIGSMFKVDASYLSPNVNMAARLEAATKQFDVPLLLSEDFVRLLSPAGRRGCRQIDRVTVKGSAQPMGLFTFDTDADFLPPPPPADPTAEDARLSMIAPMADELSYDQDIVAMHSTVDGSFLARFAAGYAAYAAGRWGEARQLLEATAAARCAPGGGMTHDGPSRTLLGVMEAYNYKAPAGWAGFRELTEK